MGASELGPAYRKARERLRREAPAICALCGGAIDLSLPKTDAMSWTADHIIPVAVDPTLAEEIYNLQPAHKRCNSSKGTRVITEYKGSKQW